MFGFEFPSIDVPEQGPPGECCVILEDGTLARSLSITVSTQDGTAIGRILIVACNTRFLFHNIILYMCIYRWARLHPWPICTHTELPCSVWARYKEMSPDLGH